MSSLSKILKGVELEAKPFSLKSLPSETAKKAPVNIVGVEKKAYTALNRSLQDNANMLIKDAIDRSMQIIEEAELKARDILKAAEDKKDQIEKQAYRAGYEAGKNQGYEKGFQQSSD